MLYASFLPESHALDVLEHSSSAITITENFKYLAVFQLLEVIKGF
tara:strand:- start:114 stop:248 length:135 start_codon:yes stop_codon:yes gene_type:complete